LLKKLETNILISGKIIKELPGSVASETPYINVWAYKKPSFDCSPKYRQPETVDKITDPFRWSRKSKVQK